MRTDESRRAGLLKTTGREIKETIMRTLLNLCIAALAAALVAACNDGTGGSSAAIDGSGARGSLMFNPPLRIATLTAADFQAQLAATPAGQQLLLVTGVPTCGVDFHYIQYGTVDGGNPQAPTSASGALMVPTGVAPACSGPRPILLYAHGTATNKLMNIADITNPNNTEGALIAAMFAAQGFIVVAPNYAGYDTSPLPYHPFLNGDQQSKEMIDALKAARKALGNIPASSTTDAGLLFVTGYSQGGYVAMATAKAMQALQPTDPTLTVTASGPMSGPYALEAFGDMVFFGGVNLGSTIFGPMIATSYQRQFGNIYNSPTDTTNLFASQYAATIDALLPSSTPLSTLISTGKLPQLGLLSTVKPTGTCNDPFFNANTPFMGGTPSQNALFALGFTPNGGDPSPNLIVNSARVGVVCDAFAHPDGAFPTPSAGVPLAATPQNPLRQGLKANDMRTWHPTHPVFLCGGGNDPTVFFQTNTVTMAGTAPNGGTAANGSGSFWSTEVGLGLVRVIDVDTAATGDPFDPIRAGFAAAVSATSMAAGGGIPGAQAVTQAYHGTLVPPFCSAAVRGFFAQVLGTIPFPFP
jgi:acetyl esterase/lipase